MFCGYEEDMIKTDLILYSWVETFHKLDRYRNMKKSDTIFWQSENIEFFRAVFFLRKSWYDYDNPLWCALNSFVAILKKAAQLIFFQNIKYFLELSLIKWHLKIRG